MTANDEYHISFHQKLRYFALQQDAATQSSDIRRNRVFLEQLLDSRKRNIAMGGAFCSPTGSIRSRAACSIASFNRSNTSRRYGGGPPSLSPQAASQTSPAAKGEGRKSFIVAGLHADRRDRHPAFDVTVQYAEECIFAAYFLVSRGLYDDAMNICLKSIEKDVNTTLRDACAVAGTVSAISKSARKTTAFGRLLQTEGETPTAGRRSLRFVSKEVDQERRAKFTDAWRVVVQYELLTQACQFFRLFTGASSFRCRPGVLQQATSCLENVVHRLVSACDVEADLNYFVLFNATVMIYEMCLHLMRFASGSTAVVMPVIARSTAYCIEVCESGTLKLSTSRYLLWRVRLYELLCNCYERQGMYEEALHQAQRTLVKVRELVELEFVDGVGPSEETREILLVALYNVHLTVLRYTWYVNGSGAERYSPPQPSVGGAGDGAHGTKQVPSVGDSTVRDGSEAYNGDLPCSGLDVLDKAWQTLMRVELPTASEVSAALVGGAGYRLNKAKQQQKSRDRRNMDALKKTRLVERARGPLMRFLLAVAITSIPPTTRPRSRTDQLGDAAFDPSTFMGKLHLWATSALEFLARHAVRNYLKENPTIAERCRLEGFDSSETTKAANNAFAVDAPATKSTGKKSAAPRRKGREGNVVPQEFSVVEDDVLLGSITLEALLCEIGYPKPPGPFLFHGNEEQRDGRSISRLTETEEESIATALLLHCVLYDAPDVDLYGRLCICSTSLLWRKLGESDEGLASRPVSPSPESGKVGGRHSRSPVWALANVFTASLHILRHMRRVRGCGAAESGADRHSLEDIYSIFPVAEHLRRLLEQCKGPLLISVSNSNNNDSAIAVAFGAPVDGLSSASPSMTSSSVLYPPLLSSTTAVSESVRVVCQQLLERGAEFLLHRMARYSPSKLPVVTRSAPLLRDGNGVSVASGHQLDKDPVELYHEIICTYLDVKASSGLTSAVDFSELVLRYAKEVVAEVEVVKEKVVGAQGAGDDNDGNAVSGEAAAGSASPTSHQGGEVGGSVDGLPKGVDSACVFRKKHHHAMLGISAINIALRWLSSATHLLDMHNSAQVAGVDTGARLGLGSHVSALVASGEQEVRDIRTDLMRCRIELCWCASLYQQSFAAIERHREDVTRIKERQAKANIYGAVTLKEKNILKSLIQEEPQFLDTNERERKRLVAWARESSDALLLALVLLCLASHQPRRKVQREMLEEAFHLLCRPEWSGSNGSFGVDKLAPREGSAYSPLMIWCYAVTICGKLGFTEWMEKSRDVLHAAFLCDKSNAPCLRDSAASRSVGTITREAATVTAEGSRRSPSPTGDGNTIISPLEFQPSEEILSASSPLQLRALVSAILWMSVGDMKGHAYKNFCTTGLMPFTEHSMLVEVPFPKRYKLQETQVVYMRCAYRIRFVMELAFRVKDYGRMMRCAFELFNALLPTLVDDNYCPVVLRPLGTLCKILLLHPTSTSDDPDVQLLAVRVLGALLLTIRRMASMPCSAPCANLHADTNSKDQIVGQQAGATTPAGAPVVSPERCSEDLSDLPSTIAGWYELLLQAFERVWNDVYNAPNLRQRRHRHRIRCSARRVQRVVNSKGSAPEGTQGTPAPGNRGENASRGTSSRLRRGSRVGSAAPSQTTGAPAECAAGVSTFPGSSYVMLDDIVDDCVPIEYVELLGEILFKVPAQVAGSLRKVFSSCDKALDSVLAATPNCVVLEGIPPWLLEVVRAVHSRSAQLAIERLHQVCDHPMYARTAAYVVESLMEQGDVVNARRLALDTLKRLKDIRTLINEHQNGLIESMRSWLRREGYLHIQLKGTSSVDASTTDNPTALESAKELAAEDARAQVAPINELGQHIVSNTAEGEWSPVEKETLRQLTRGFAWVWRRQIARWLRARIMQFCVPFTAKLYFFLEKMSLLQLEQCQVLQEKATLDTSGKVSRRASKVKGGVDESVSALTEDMPKGKRAVQGTALDEGDEEERFLSHAMRSARLFNRCGLPAQAFQVVLLAVDGIRTFVCDDPADVQPLNDAQQTLAEDAGGRGSPSCGGTYSSDAADGFIDPRLYRFVGTLSATEQRASVMRTGPRSREKLVALGPYICPLAQTMQRTLLLLWEGYVDYRRDLGIVQPNAVKVRRDVLLDEQLPFQGRVPSLFSLFSPAGQYEEAYLEHARDVEQRKRGHSLLYQTHEVCARESFERTRIQWQSSLQLSSLMEMWVDVIPDVGYFLRELEVDCSLLEQEAEERKCAYDTAVVQRQQWEARVSKKRRKKTEEAGTVRCITKPISFEDPNGMELAAKRLGYTIPMGTAIDKLVFLLKCAQFSCQLASLQIAEEVQKLTSGSFSRHLLPFVLNVQCMIGEPIAKETVDKLLEVYRDESRQKSLSRNARWTWRRYTKTEAYSRAMQRLGRTLLPSWGTQGDSKMSVLSMPNASFNFSADECSLVSDVLVETSRPRATVRADDSVVCGTNPPNADDTNGASRPTSLHDVTGSYDNLISYLRQRRLFGPLAEELYELGRIYILHRQRDEAERCWLDSVDAALGVPESLRNSTAVDTWSEFQAASVGCPRILLAILSLTSLAMYTYREQQKRAVDACLLSARVLERLFEQSSGSGLPQCLRDFCGFALEDIIVLPHLREPLTTLMPQIIHHLLFLGWELLQFKFPVYSAMVACLAEYLARTYTRHVPLTVEIRLLQAKAAAYSGNFRASMGILRDVCQGKRVPCVALESFDLCASGSEALKTTKGLKGADTGAQSRRQAEPAAEAPNNQALQQQQHQEESSQSGLYNDTELPTSPGNVACIQVFITQCFTSPGSDDRPAADAAGASVGQAVSSLMSGASGLPEPVAAYYGKRLSQRVELTLAECLVVLGGKEAAYVWGSLGGQSQPPASGTTTGADRRAMRSRGSQRPMNLTYNNSACREALNAAEQILQVILARLQKVQQQRQGERQQHPRQSGNSTSTVGDGNAFVLRGRKSVPRDSAPPSSRLPDGGNAKRWREVEDTYTRCTSERLLSRIYTVRGESMKALGLLKGLVRSFENGGSFVCNIPHVPSFLWTVGTHNFWCEVYELMTQNHVRLLEYSVAQKVVDHALALCEQCGDSYSARVFSLYRATISMRTGTASDAEETLNGLLDVSRSLVCDSRMDLFHPWTILALEALRREKQCKESQKGSTSSIDLLEGAVLNLQEYSQVHSLLPLTFCFNERKQDDSREVTKRENRREVLWKQLAPLPWSTDAVYVHRAVNTLAEEHIRVGLLDQAEHLLQDVILSVASRYDTAAHPTALIESHFMLARLLCLRNPSLITARQEENPLQQQRKGGETMGGAPVTVMAHEMSSEEEMIASLEPYRQNPVRLLMSVVKQVVSVGIHDYNILRVALLLLSALFSHAGRAFCIVAANCAVLAKLVADMKFHVFSGTSVFSLYGDDAISLGTDVVFAESVTAYIHYQQRNVGNVMEKEGPGWDNAAGGGGSLPPSGPSHPRTRDDRERAAQRNNVSLPAVVSAFAALHRERSLDCLLPPQESLDLELALQHVRSFLQTRTAPLSCSYLWHSEGALESILKQQASSATRPGGAFRTQRTGASTATVIGDDNASPAGFLPPVIIDALPSLLSPQTLQQLHVPRANTVICNTFQYESASADPVAYNENMSIRAASPRCGQGANGGGAACKQAEPVSTLKFVLVVSPANDPAATQPPSVAEKPYHPTKKTARATNKGMTHSLAASTGEGPRWVDAGSIFNMWNSTQCVVFDCPVAEMRQLQAQAAHTLLLMQSPAPSLPLAKAPPGVEGAVDEEDIAAGAALTQQLNEVLSVLFTKLAPPTTGRKAMRAPMTVEGLLSGASNLNATPFGNNSGAVGASGNHGNPWGGRAAIVGAGATDKVASGTAPGYKEKGADDGCDESDEVSPVDEAKSKLVADFIQMIVASIIPRAVVDDALMERNVQMLMPRCAVTVDVVRFLMAVTSNDGHGMSSFNPGLHDWFSRIAAFGSGQVVR
ncbi:protein of unknown function (DUF4486), putative [Trypanosoma equiperdum]|uniref:Uncharacterized protein n=1 Tax=Trypanosoma equiperdum TaxID=5694 RepID=A0A1G4IKV1_TRYEQ|nr:Domain of unknown function (DUF4486), putative [Trypanosoma equiperdum]